MKKRKEVLYKLWYLDYCMFLFIIMFYNFGKFKYRGKGKKNQDMENLYKLIFIKVSCRGSGFVQLEN